jgi:hypothetical protein
MRILHFRRSLTFREESIPPAAIQLLNQPGPQSRTNSDQVARITSTNPTLVAECANRQPSRHCMDRADELVIIRRAYAKQVLASVGLNDPRVEAAFAAVERERYLGPGPWPILRSFGYVPTPDADPVYLYSDVLIGIVSERGLNNGMPSYHAPLISSADIRAGEHVVHIGAGVGYYTAIMAHLVGRHGRVTAIEVDFGACTARYREFFAHCQRQRAAR